LKDTAKRPVDRILPKPKNEYIQQGGLILKKVRKIPKGAKRINIKGKTFDLGGGHKLVVK
jgi:CBS domain containing-hemolysin-like protein